MSTIRVQSPGMTPNRPERCWNELDHKDFLRWVKIWGSEIEASYWLRAKNRGLSLVEKTWLKNSRHSPSLQKSLPFHSFQISILSIRLHSSQSDCNINNRTAISTIRVQKSRNLLEYPSLVAGAWTERQKMYHGGSFLKLADDNMDIQNPEAQNRELSGFWEKVIFLPFPHEKTTFQWPKVVSEAIFPTN